MTAPVLTPVRDSREGRDRLEIMTALVNSPSFDPVFRSEIVEIPPDHPVYRWVCLVTDCERPRAGRGDLCGAHETAWRQLRAERSRADFLRTADLVGHGEELRERLCRLCPERPSRQLTLKLCHHHQFSWYHYRDRHGDAADFDTWLAKQLPRPGYGRCKAVVCPDLAESPLGLCYRHHRRYLREGRPGGAVLPAQWGNRYERVGSPVPVSYDNESDFRWWCSRMAPVSRPGQINLRGLHPLLRAEIQWGLFVHARGSGRRWELTQIQSLADYCRDHGFHSLTDLAAGSVDPDEEGGRLTTVGREASYLARILIDLLTPLYVTPEQTREQGYLNTVHFGRRLNNRSPRIDLTSISQRWLRDLAWDHFAAILRSPSCPRSGHTFDGTRRACTELSAFLEIQAPGGGHDPRLLRPHHVHDFAADQRLRELDGLPSLGVKGLHGKPSIVTAYTRQMVFTRTRRILLEALESGEAERLGLDRGFVTAMPSPGRIITRTQTPFSDEVARALAAETNLQTLAACHDPADRGLRDAWETIIVTGRRCSEVIKLRLDCLGRYGGLPMLWHDQTKVGNYDAAIRIPEQLHQRLEARQRKTLALFATRHNRPPTPEERAHLPLFPSNQRNSDSRRPLSYQWFHRGFKAWINGLDIGRWVPHQARHSLATSLLRAGASLTHIRRYLGQVSERMAERYVHLAQSDLESVLQHVWVAGPGAANPGEILTDDLTPLNQEHAMAIAIDLGRRSTPAEGGFCTFQPVVDGGDCPWSLNCHSCDKFVLPGADLLYWRRKREPWRLLAEGAPDDATADYLHVYFEPTARAIDGLEKALAGLGLLDDALALDLRKPQDYFHRVWSTAFRAADLVDVGAEGESEYRNTYTPEDTDPEQDVA
ncbi:site-specific integrase [Streptomyces sp. NBC_00873]|uniref:tyrosine-type recombinase/integrase n=1 Tax=Streptomyces sp. NBC_00873 TaxID=2975852 RepID=UPI00386CF073|nr:site-specific integrase [Streptomyces sp. NBC_00873]